MRLILFRIAAVVCATVILTACSHPQSFQEKNPDQIIVKASFKPSLFNDDQVLLSIEGRQIPSGKKYVMYTRNLKGDYSKNTVYTSNGRGNLNSKNFPSSSHYMYMHDVLPGEPIFISLVSTDGTTCTTIRAVPHPIYSKGKDGAVLSVILGKLNGLNFILLGEGFKPHEKMSYLLQDDPSGKIHEIVASENGVFEIPFSMAPYQPAVTPAVIELNRDDEVLYLRFEWGLAAISPAKRKGLSPVGIDNLKRWKQWRGID